MIKQLRRRFILVSMLAVLVVLFLIISTINILNYLSITTDSDGILQAMKANGGSLADMQAPSPDPGGQDSAAGQAPPQNTDPGQSGDPGNPGGVITAETPYESRYFSVTLDTDGNVTAADMNNIVSVDSAQAEEYAKEIWASGKQKGFIGHFRYLVYELAEEDQTETESISGSGPAGGQVRVCFLDCQRSLTNFRYFLSASLLVSLFGSLAVFVLVVLFSGRVIRPVEESYKKQKRFITDAGHELKTPLTIIEADVSALEMDIGENEWLEDIQRQTSRMTNLTGDLIYLSRMDEGQTKLNMLEFPLSDVVSETAQSFRSRAQLEQKSFAMDIEPMLSFCGDEKSIRELVEILLDNAVKYSGERGDIRVSLKKKNRSILLTVWNTADQVDRQMLSHMFERFYRADSSRNSESGGYGIGLSVAEAVTTAHKGKIRASSADGASITITVSLPAD